MSSNAADKSELNKPIIPSVTAVVGLLIGLAGLVMTILGIGGVSATHLSFADTVNVQTTSGGVLAMVVGLGTALYIQVMIIRVDLESAKHGGDTKYARNMEYMRMGPTFGDDDDLDLEKMLGKDNPGAESDKGDVSQQNHTVHVDFVGRPGENGEYIEWYRDSSGITMRSTGGDKTKTLFYPWSSIFSITESSVGE